MGAGNGLEQSFNAGISSSDPRTEVLPLHETVMFLGVYDRECKCCRDDMFPAQVQAPVFRGLTMYTSGDFCNQDGCSQESAVQSNRLLGLYVQPEDQKHLQGREWLPPAFDKNAPCATPASATADFEQESMVSCKKPAGDLPYLHRSMNNNVPRAMLNRRATAESQHERLSSWGKKFTMWTCDVGQQRLQNVLLELLICVGLGPVGRTMSAIHWSPPKRAWLNAWILDRRVDLQTGCKVRARLPCR